MVAPVIVHGLKWRAVSESLFKEVRLAACASCEYLQHDSINGLMIDEQEESVVIVLEKRMQKESLQRNDS